MKRYAIIPAAGLGTRFLPVTRTIPKEMLPIGPKPALQYLVDEALRAGCEQVVIIISHAKELVRRHFEAGTAYSGRLVWVYQEEQHGLGHAVYQVAKAKALPKLTAEDQLLILLGDALVFGCDASSEMVRLSEKNGGAAVIGCEHVPDEKVSRYGILKLEGNRVVDMIEKPSLAEAPSNLAVAGRYLLPAVIFDFLKTQSQGKGGEIQLTDSIRRMLSNPQVSTPALLPYVYPGRRQDIGNPDGYFEALKFFYTMR